MIVWGFSLSFSADVGRWTPRDEIKRLRVACEVAIAHLAAMTHEDGWKEMNQFRDRYHAVSLETMWEDFRDEKYSYVTSWGWLKGMRPNHPTRDVILSHITLRLAHLAVILQFVEDTPLDAEDEAGPSGTQP